MQPESPEKIDLRQSIKTIIKYIEEGNTTRKPLVEVVWKMHTNIYGDPDANPPIKGFEERVKDLEDKEKIRTNADNTTRNSLLKLAVGSLTMMVGSGLLWVFITLKAAFVKGH